MKSYLIIILSFYSFFMYSQIFEAECIAKNQQYDNSVVQNNKNAIVIWSEDFGNGFSI